MKIVRIIGICLFMITLTIPGNSSAETAPPEVLAAAEGGLLPFLEQLPSSEWKHFGFAPGDKISEALLGAPFKVYTITPDALAAYQAGDSVGSLLSPTGMWYFPVILTGDTRCVLTVAKMDGSWQAVGIGKTPLAAQLQRLKKQWPKSGGYEPILIEVFQVPAFFFTVPQAGEDNLSSFVFGGKGFSGKVKTGEPVYSSLTGLSEIIGRLKSVVAENIKQSTR